MTISAVGRPANLWHPLEPPAPSRPKGPVAPAMLQENATDDRRSLGRSQPDPQALKEVFSDFVGRTVYGQMLAAMRKTVGKPAYLHGGRAEEIFQGQLDEAIAKQLSDASAATFSEPMFELFNLSRK